MRKAGVIILLLFVFSSISLAAQENDDSDWDYYDQDLYTRGDKTFIITLGVVFPMIFSNNGKVIDNKITPPIGGTGSLSLNYYLTKNIFIGVEASGMFFGTLGGNTLFIIPIGARAGYQFNVWRLEFPLNITLGMVWHRYLNSGYYGIYFKGGGSVYFRATQAWSFGLNVDWYWLPEWTNDKSKNVDGSVLDLTLSARYHF